MPDFIEDIKSSATLLCINGAVDDLVEAYSSGVKFLINKHAPLQTKTITLRKSTTIRDNSDNHKFTIRHAVGMSADIKFEGQPLTKCTLYYH